MIAVWRERLHFLCRWAPDRLSMPQPYLPTYRCMDLVGLEKEPMKLGGESDEGSGVERSWNGRELEGYLIETYPTHV